MALTKKQKLFVEEYLIDLNATQAAIRAGYSPKGINKRVTRMMANEGISEYMQKLMEERESALIAKVDEVLQTLTRVLRRTATESIVSSKKIRRSYFDEQGRKCVEESEVPVIVEVPTKISDVNKAAELLGKRYGLFTDKFKVEGAIPIVIHDDLDDEDDDE